MSLYIINTEHYFKKKDIEFYEIYDSYIKLKESNNPIDKNILACLRDNIR